VQNVEIQALGSGHWADVRSIYIEGIATGEATFETQPSDWEMWDTSHFPFARLIALSQVTVIGWAAIAPVSNRRAYSGVAEVSVYLRGEWRGKGYGRLLLQTLIGESEKNGIWTLQASVFPENRASIALHKGCGFREVGFRERISKLNGVWRTTILLERRSSRIGLA
jgi:L-amino acid N-acyltransferase YncA